MTRSCWATSQAPGTTKSHPAPFRIEVTHIGKKGLILLDQIRTIDQIRLVKKLGALQSTVLAVTLRTLQETFAQ
jgi:mRNA interferase MazF